MIRYKIIENKIKCNRCGEIIESKTVHDFVSCSCGCCVVDGGHNYIRRGWKYSKKDYTELSVLLDENGQNTWLEKLKRFEQEKQSDVSLGKVISYILRHHPEKFDVKLDQNGWANVEQLLQKMNAYDYSINFETLERIVTENNKQRYTFNDDKTKIRANQGHSILVDVELKERVPQDVLYHGTAEKNLVSIMRNGLIKKNRLYVHLSKDYETAIQVGKRHGKPVVLEIDTKKMVKDGYKFYLSENGVWLTDKVPASYLKRIKKEV